ncbi:MAG TPA: hypothetical protein DCE08_04465 [Ruminococcaceae bacterium]|nr:hypothetical protein [Oscillospiraceae bacterium]
MSIDNGVTYRLECRADRNRSLNVYGTTPTSLANVCLYNSANNDICQQWVFVESGGNNKGYLKCKGNPQLMLDIYTGTSNPTISGVNAQVYAQSETAYFEIEDSSNGYIKIKSLYNGRYLTANQGKNGTSGGKGVNSGGNVYFYNGGLTDNSQDWLPIKLDNGGDEPGEAPIAPPSDIESVDIMQRYNAPLPFTGSKITIYNVKTDSNEKNDKSKEQYHRGSGFRPSENNMNFLDTEKGQTVLSTIQNFAKTVFNQTDLPARWQVAYYLFGEFDQNAKFHHGVDMDVHDGDAIHAFWGGEVVSKGGNYGRVQIYVADLDVTTIYLHMKNIPNTFNVGDYIEEGTVIGYQSNVSRDSIRSHLHFEVRRGRTVYAGDSTISDANKALASIIPYGYMKK